MGEHCIIFCSVRSALSNLRLTSENTIPLPREDDRNMIVRKQPDPIRRPEEILGEVRLERFKELAWFLGFGTPFFGSLLLFYIFSVTHPLVYSLGFLGAIGAIPLGLIVLLSIPLQITYWDVVKILISPAGLYLEDTHGKITYVLPCSSVKRILYFNEEDGLTPNPGMGIRNSYSVDFLLTDGKFFTIYVHHVIAADRENLFSLLAAAGFHSAYTCLDA